MKTLFPILCIILFFTNVNAQTAAIQFDKQNILYINEDNPLTIVAEGYSCKQLVITTPNGTITGENGHYMVRPQFPDPHTIIHVKIKTRRRLRELATYTYRAKYRPVQMTR